MQLQTYKTGVVNNKFSFMLEIRMLGKRPAAFKHFIEMYKKILLVLFNDMTNKYPINKKTTFTTRNSARHNYTAFTTTCPSNIVVFQHVLRCTTAGTALHLNLTRLLKWHAMWTRTRHVHFASFGGLFGALKSECIVVQL